MVIKHVSSFVHVELFIIRAKEIHIGFAVVCEDIVEHTNEQESRIL